MQPFVNYNFPGGLYLNSAPIITANWKADSGERWTVPLGGGIGKIFHLGQLPVNSQLGAYYNVVNARFRPGLADARPGAVHVSEVTVPMLSPIAERKPWASASASRARFGYEAPLKRSDQTPMLCLHSLRRRVEIGAAICSRGLTP